MVSLRQAARRRQTVSISITEQLVAVEGIHIHKKRGRETDIPRLQDLDVTALPVGPSPSDKDPFGDALKVRLAAHLATTRVGTGVFMPVDMGGL